MKLLPLSVKKKISTFLNKNVFGDMTAIFLIVGSFFGGIGGLIAYQSIGNSKEKAVLEQKVDHLLTTYQLSHSMHNVVQAAEGRTDFGLDFTTAREKEAALTAAFNAEAEQTAIALAHARKISPDQRSELYKKLAEVKPRPDYFRDGKDGGDSYLLFSFAQSRVMNRPGFAPTIETAREIVEYPALAGTIVVTGMFGPLVLSIAGVVGFCAVRRRLDDSVHTEEQAIKRAENERKRAEEENVKKAEAEAAAREAARLAAEAAEAERLASLPPSVALDRDISVRQLRLENKGNLPKP